MTRNCMAACLLLGLFYPEFAWAQLPRSNFSGDGFVGDVLIYSDQRISDQLAYRMELQNKLFKVEINNQIKNAYREQKAKEYVSALDKERSKAERKKQWLLEFPELAESSVVTGEALNFLLSRLSSGVIKYQSTSGNDSSTTDLMKDFKLDPQIKHSLRMSQKTGTRQTKVFRADEGEGLQVDWWPSCFRSGELQTHRVAFERARDEFLSPGAKTKAEMDRHSQLMTAFENLKREFEAAHPREVRIKSVVDHAEYGRSKRFLESLAGELYRARDIGAEAFTDTSLKFDGEDLFDLITHMSRQGLEFSPASPGEESAYFTVFEMMRDVYAVASANQSSK